MTNVYENKSYNYENCLYLIHSFPFLSLLSTVEGLILPNPKEQELGSSFKLFFRFFWAIDYYLTCRYLSKKKRCFAAYNPLLLHVQYLIIKVWARVCSSSRENYFSPDSRSEAILETLEEHARLTSQKYLGVVGVLIKITRAIAFGAVR